MARSFDVHCAGCGDVIAKCFASGHPMPSIYCEPCAEREEEEDGEQ